MITSTMPSEDRIDAMLPGKEMDAAIRDALEETADLPYSTDETTACQWLLPTLLRRCRARGYMHEAEVSYDLDATNTWTVVLPDGSIGRGRFLAGAIARAALHHLAVGTRS